MRQIKYMYSLAFRTYFANIWLLAAVISALETFLSGTASLGSGIFILAAAAYIMHLRILVFEGFLPVETLKTTPGWGKFIGLYFAMFCLVLVGVAIVAFVVGRPGPSAPDFLNRLVLLGGGFALFALLLFAAIGPAFPAILTGEEWPFWDTIANTRQHIWRVVGLLFAGSIPVYILLVIANVTFNSLGVPISGMTDSGETSPIGLVVEAIVELALFFPAALGVAAFSIAYMERVGSAP